MNFYLEKVNKDQKNILDNLLEYYLYDFNIFYEDDLNENGRFEFIKTSEYFEKEKYDAYFIKVNNNYAGFVLINNQTELIDKGTRIEEFWIVPKYRKTYFAFQILRELLRMYNENVEFMILEKNERWKKIIEYMINKNLKLINQKEILKWDSEKFKLYLVNYKK